MKQKTAEGGILMEQNKTARIVSFKRFEIHDGDGIRTTLFLRAAPLTANGAIIPNPYSFKRKFFMMKGFAKTVCAAQSSAMQTKFGTESTFS